MDKVLTNEEALSLDAYFRLANYLSCGQLYLLDNPLLKRPLERKDIKRKIVGHWGTVPGQNFIYTHLNRIINKYDLSFLIKVNKIDIIHIKAINLILHKKVIILKK